MRKRDLKIIEEMKALISKKLKIHEVRVFGSRARGDAAQYSDLDVLIIADSLDHSIEKYISDCAWDVGFANDVVIMPIVITKNVLENSPIKESVFIKNVYREGVLV